MNNKEAISKLRQIKNYYHFESYAKDLDYKIEALDLAIKALENERPQGEWVVSGLDYKCSNCGMIPIFRQYNFCPNCGAEMRKEEV